MQRAVLRGFLLVWPLVGGSVAAEPPALPARPKIDEQRLAAEGIRRVAGKHLILFTDQPVTAAMEQLPPVFDAAVPQWCKCFDTPSADAENFQMIGYLMKDPRRFRAAGVLPDDLPKFSNGYQRAWELWIHEQPSDYYRRHLLLHEGTHAFMTWRYRAVGPPWYMEGMAELFGTHVWEKGKLTTRYLPPSKEEVDHWGRIRIIKEEVEAGRALTLVGVLKLPPDAHRRTEPYAWCWAAAWFFENHPLSRAAFLELKDHLVDDASDFSRQFYERLKPHWDELSEQWQLFIVNIEYGYDLPRAMIQRKPARELGSESADVSISASRGWQSAGLRLKAGRDYKIRAVGRYQVVKHPRIWWCEPGGVTIQYYRGQPLGMLLGAVRGDTQPSRGLTPLANPEAMGLVHTLRCRRDGILYLRINESAANLGDNSGELTVRVQPLP